MNDYEGEIEFVCEIPKDLGRVTKIEQRDGKIVVRTESGIQMIVPWGKFPAKEVAKE